MSAAVPRRLVLNNVDVSMWEVEDVELFVQAVELGVGKLGRKFFREPAGWLEIQDTQARSSRKYADRKHNRELV